MSNPSIPYCQTSTLSLIAGLVAAFDNTALELALALAVHHMPVWVDEADAATVAVGEPPLTRLEEVLADDISEDGSVDALELWLVSASPPVESASLTLILV